MATRRELLKGLGGAAVAAAFAGSAAAARAPGTAAAPRRAWPRYGSAPVLDGAGGVNLLWYGPDDPAVPGELAAIRASGLTAVVLTLAPSGRFWLDDAAFGKTKANFDAWQGIVARYPDHLMMIRSADDLDRARREHRLGLICTFQGTESLGEDLDRLTMFRERGLRVLQLTHNRRNLVGDGCMEPGNAGLSNFGHEVIARIEAEKSVDAGGQGRVIGMCQEPDQPAAVSVARDWRQGRGHPVERAARASTPGGREGPRGESTVRSPPCRRKPEWLVMEPDQETPPMKVMAA